MTLTREQLGTVLGEIGPVLQQGVLQKMRVPDRERVVLEIRQPGQTHQLLLCSAPRLGRLHLIDAAPPNPRESLTFQGLLRKELKGRLLIVEQLDGERIVRLVFAGADARRTLVLELYGAGGNIALLDEEDRVLGRAGSARRPGCSAGRGELWEPPSGTATWRAPLAVDGLVQSTAMNARYALIEAGLTAAERTDRVRSRLTRRRKELRRTQKRQRGDIDRIGDPGPLRRRAELLQGSFHLLSKGTATVTVTDWAAAGQPQVVVLLDPALGPAEQVRKAFARARRAERAMVAGHERLGATTAALAEIGELLDLLDDDPDTAIGLANELAPATRTRGKVGRRVGPRLPYVAWRTPSGHEIRVGRSASDNDQLTLRHSKGNDVWLHVRGRPGAHVIVREPGPSPSTELLILGAQLALVHSGLSDGAKEEVTWTRAKHVSKPKGSKPGSVVARQDKVLYVEVDRSVLDALTRAGT